MHNFIWEGEIDVGICDDVVEFYDTCTYLPKIEYNGLYSQRHLQATGKESTDMHCHTMLAKNEKVLDTYMRSLMDCLQDYYRTYPQAGELDCHVAPMFNIQRYKPNQGYKTWHYERGMQRINRERFLVWMTYLSDNPDGGTEWKYQDKYIPAKKGATVIWPAEWTHTHRGVVDKKLEKTIITGWFDIEAGFSI